ncbi:MAG: hypothetical protein N2645_17860, partial [Clostridia bacterium]|nr:hypothetical protein [Clostridia bacterium]
MLWDVKFCKGKHFEITKNTLVLSTLFFLLIKIPLFSIDFNLTPLKLSFFGAVNVKNNIIVYGDFGSYLFSTDLGNTWEQRFIGIFDEIRSIVNFNDTLFGVTLNGNLIISPDKGESWEIKKVNKEVWEKFLDILVINDAIYIRSLRKILKLNREGQIIKLLENPIFEPSKSSEYDGDIDELINDYHLYCNHRFYLYDNNIILNSDKFCDSGFIYVDLNLNNIVKVYLKDELKYWGGCCETVKVLNFGEKDIFKITMHLYIPDDSLKNFKYFYQDTSFMFVVNSTKSLHKWFNIGGNPDLYFTVKDTLFIGRWEDSTKYDTLSNTGGVLIRIPYPQFNLYSIKKYISYPRDTFVLQGLPFYDTYNGSKYHFIDYIYPGLFRNIETPSCVVNDSVWVYVNRKRFILLTTNKGHSWKMISYLTGKPREILNDSTFFFLFEAPELTEVNRTLDAGISFQPSFNFHTSYKSRRNISYFYKVHFFYIDSSGRGFLKGSSKYSGPGTIYNTYDFWKFYNNFVDSIEIFVPSSLLTKFVPSNIVRYKDCFLLCSNADNSNQGYPPLSILYVLDTSLKFAKFSKVSYRTNIIHILPTYDSVNNFIFFALISDSLLPQINWLEIRETNDTGKTSSLIYKMVDYGQEIVQFYQHNKDTVFFTTSLPDRLFLFDRKTYSVKKLWESEATDFEPRLMVISDRFYIVGRGLFLENTERSDLTKWREGKWDYGKPNFESVIFRGNVAIAGLSDSVRPFNYYKITL